MLRNGGPQVLIERLDDVMRLGQRLSKTNGENELAIAEVAKNLSERHFPGAGERWRRVRQQNQTTHGAVRGRSDDTEWIARAEK